MCNQSISVYTLYLIVIDGARESIVAQLHQCAQRVPHRLHVLQSPRDLLVTTDRLVHQLLTLGEQAVLLPLEHSHLILDTFLLRQLQLH